MRRSIALLCLNAAGASAAATTSVLLGAATKSHNRTQPQNNEQVSHSFHSLQNWLDESELWLSPRSHRSLLPRCRERASLRSCRTGVSLDRTDCQIHRIGVHGMSPCRLKGGHLEHPWDSPMGVPDTRRIVRPWIGESATP
jgi:hypothetical protein